MTVTHHLRVHRSDENLAREGQLAWRIAEVAADPVEVEPEVVDMIINRVIDNAAVAAASLTRAPVSAARQQALDHAVSIGGAGATVFGCALERRIEPRVGGVGERRRRARARLPRHLPRGRLLAPGRQHPADPRRRPARRIATAPRSCAASPPATRSRSTSCSAICLHKHKIDHVAHLGPSAAAGIGTLLGLDAETIYQAVGQALHTTTATRQSPQGRDLDLEGARPGLRRQDGGRGGRPRDARRDLAEPDLRGRGRRHRLAARRPGRLVRGAAARRGRGEARRSSTPTRRSTRPSTRRRPGSTSPASSATSTRTLRDPANVESIVLHTSHHTHYVIGSGANDPQKYDPTASRETLDHSIPYIFAVALQDGGWHHVDSYAPERAGRADTVALWHKITTAEDAEWTRRYHSDDPNEKAFGGRVEITLTDGTDDRRRDRRRRRAPARRPAVRPRGLHPQVPHPRRAACSSRPRSSGSSSSPSACPSSPPTRSRSSRSSRSRRARRRPAPKGLF